MFESIKSMNIKQEEECEECGYKDVLVNTIISGQQKRICQRCINTNPIILIKKPRDIKEEDVPRRSVHEILEEMSGIKPQPLEKPPSEIKLEDLRERYEELKKKRRLRRIEERLGKPEQVVLDEKKFIENLETEKPKEEPKEEPVEEKKEEREIDFSIESAKHTKISELLKKIKKTDEETEKKAEEENKKEEDSYKIETVFYETDNEEKI